MIKEVKLTRPTWVEVNLDHLKNNIKEVRRVTKKSALVTAVIKADGYGHGAVEIGDVLLKNGADRFAVATLSEAVQLRKYYPNVEIMILGYTPSEDAEVVIKNNIIQTIYDLKQAIKFNNIAKELDKNIKLHIKIDTGMHRLGMQPTEETIHTISKIDQLSNVIIEGIFTHFAVADEKDKTYTKLQVEKFNWVLEQLTNHNINIPIKHVSNSAAIIDMQELNYDMVRAGVMLYGLYPSKAVKKSNVNLKQVMSLKTKISHIKTLEADKGISYGLIYTTKKETKVATLPIGYADGFTRLLSEKTFGIVANHKKPLIGRICMDQCMIDVSNLEVKVGDEVTLFGQSGNHMILIDEIADAINTINYEIVCMISKRVPRVYTINNKAVDIKDIILNL